jgi:glycosyltransferase involved in cell wall biosynthesis
MKKVLFIGNFLSKHRGTIGPMEGVMRRMKNNIIISRASVYDHKVLKLVDMFVKSLCVNYDIIHIDTYSSSAISFAYFSAYIGKIRRKKVVLNLRGGGLFRLFQNNPQKNKLIRKLFSNASEIVTPSLYLKENFEKHGFIISYLPNTVDLQKFPYSEILIDNHKLLWVRAFNATYQPWLAVKTLYEVRKKYADATLTMIGPDKGLLAQTVLLITELGLTDYIHITGKVPNDQLAEYYHTHQVFLNTTDTESFGVAVMEAASCGIPVVTTSVGELPYLWMNEENAMLINSFDEKDFAEAIFSLFEDKMLYNKIKINARKKAESFDWEVVKDKWKTLLK